MKKWIALLLAMVMLLSVTACSGGSLDDDDAKEANRGNGGNDNAPKLSFAEQVVVDNDVCTIKITGIDPDDLFGYALKVYLENKTDKALTFSVEAASTNGVDNDPYFASEVEAGKKENTSIDFSSDLDDVIGYYSDIYMEFRVYDSEEWEADDLVNVSTHVYPHGEDKATAYVRESKDSDTVLADNEYVTVIVTGYEEDEIWGYTVNYYLVNKTDKELMISVDDVSVNGYMLDPYYATTLAPGFTAFSDMYWSEDSFEENGIDNVEEIEMTLQVYDYSEWMDINYMVNETVTLNP